MRPLSSQLAAPQEASAATVIPRELQLAIRLSFEAVTQEPLPREIALLLLRLALAELLRSGGEHEEAGEPIYEAYVLEPELRRAR